MIPVFDTGALIALERRSVDMMALVALAVARSATIHTSAGVIAQVWRGDPRQHAIAKLLRSGTLQVHPIDLDTALRIGRLVKNIDRPDVVDAHLVVVARSVGGRVYTSDPHDIAALGPGLEMVTV